MLITACDSYVWIQNGQTYYTSNSTDSVIGQLLWVVAIVLFTLDLTIIPSTTSSRLYSSCDTYSWNGDYLLIKGVYTFLH